MVTRGRYASTTDVSSEASRLEIERTLRRYGASEFGYLSRASEVSVAFTAHDRWIRFSIPMPDPRSREFTHTPERGILRSVPAREAAYEQAVRQRWRSLALIVKAKLEAVDAGIVTFEEEFLAHTVVPGTGETVYEQTRGVIAAAYTDGVLARPLLQIGGAS